MSIHSKIFGGVVLEMFDDLLGYLGSLLKFLVGIVFLCDAHLALTLEPPLFEHLLTLFVFLQARYVTEFELSVGWDICLGSKDHHVANVGPTYKGKAAMIDVRRAYPNADGA